MLTVTQVISVVVLLSAYAPYSDDPINGTFCWSLPLSECPYVTGTAACGEMLPPGTLIELPAWVVGKGLPRTVICNSLGGSVKGWHADIAIIRSGVKPDHEAEQIAKDWGVPWVEVLVDFPGEQGPPPPPPPPPIAMEQPLYIRHWPTYEAMGSKMERLDRAGSIVGPTRAVRRANAPKPARG